MAESKRWKKAKMLDWFAPYQLAATGLQTFMSTQIGAMVDPRRFSATSCPDHECIHDFSQDGNNAPLQNCSFDYMADTGESWDGTFTMAYFLSKSKIMFEPNQELERGNFLILGGDQVYPVASREAYKRNLVWPFNSAAKSAQANGDADGSTRPVYLVPGNHDWYDGLGAFTHRFMTLEARPTANLGAFAPQQRRSYFVIKLPHRWQLWAIDIQLGRWIDARQDLFFRNHAKTLQRSDKIILCSAEPGVVYGRRSREDLSYYLDRIEGYVTEQHAHVRVRLAGDVHNFQHYIVPTVDPNVDQHLVVSGGGGAFLHPTHAFPRNKAPVRNKSSSTAHPRKASIPYPRPDVSRRISNGLLWFPFKHLPMSLLIGFLYLALFGFVQPGETPWLYAWYHPFGFAIGLLLGLGCVSFAAPENWWAKVSMGLVHAASHIAVAIGVWCIATAIEARFLPNATLSIYFRWLLIVMIGSTLGGLIFGAYLWIALQWLRIHHNEAFSALGNSTYKHFLRCRVAEDGTLHIAVIAVEGLLKYSETDWQTNTVKLNKTGRFENDRLKGVNVFSAQEITVH